VSGNRIACPRKDTILFGSVIEADMRSATSQAISEDGRELLRLCRTGRLYDIDRWIAAGKTLDLPGAKHKTLLQVTVETEFHGLVELIARHEMHQKCTRPLKTLH